MNVTTISKFRKNTMKLKLSALAIVITGVIFSLVVAVPAGAITQKLPNLIPLQASELATYQSGNKTFMRFSTFSWNAGTGPLEIRGGDKERQTGKQKVYQHIYNDDGTYTDLYAGSFLYHKAHRHVHFDDYAVYTLQPINAPGGSERTSAKTTFCILDTDAMYLSLPGAPQTSQYTTCNSQIQGMSVGWGDKYGSHLAGQSIDITGLPNGEYNLNIVIDPKGRIFESNDRDNVSNLRIFLNGQTVTVR